jgi:hypothetical protein
MRGPGRIGSRPLDTGGVAAAQPLLPLFHHSTFGGLRQFEDDAETDDEVADERTCGLEGTAGGTAVQFG